MHLRCAHRNALARTVYSASTDDWVAITHDWVAITHDWVAITHDWVSISQPGADSLALTLSFADHQTGRAA